MRATRMVLILIIICISSPLLNAQSGAFKIKAATGSKKNITAVINSITGEALLIFESNGKIYSSITKSKKKNPDVVRSKKALIISQNGVAAHRPTLRFSPAKNNFVFAYDTAPDELIAGSSASPSIFGSADIFIGRLQPKNGKPIGSPVNFTYIDSLYYSPYFASRPANQNDDSQFFCAQLYDYTGYYNSIYLSVTPGYVDDDLPTNMLNTIDGYSDNVFDQSHYNAMQQEKLGLLSFRVTTNDGSHFVAFYTIDPTESTVFNNSFQAAFLFYGEETNRPTSVTAEGLPRNAVLLWLQTRSNIPYTMIQSIEYVDGTINQLNETTALTAANNISGGVLYAVIDRAYTSTSISNSTFYLVGLGEDKVMRLFTCNLRGEKTATAPLFTAQGTITEMILVAVPGTRNAFLFWAQKLNDNDTQLWGWKFSLPS